MAEPLNLRLSGAVPLDGLGTPAPAGVPGIAIDVTQATFEEQVLRASMRVPVVLDFWATWCGPCRTLSPILERLAAESNGAWILAKIDCDAEPALAQAAAVQGIPSVKAVVGGQVVGEFTGALPESQVRQWIAQLLDGVRSGRFGPMGNPDDAEGADGLDGPGEELDADLADGDDALMAGDLDAAAAAYQRLDERPGVSVELRREAKAGLARVGLLRRATTLDPAELQARLAADPADVDAALGLADALVVNDRAEDAFALLLEVIRGSAGDVRDAARKHLLELFDLLGDTDPLVARARRDLAGALF